MIELGAVLRLFSLIFGVVGAMRGWVRELQVTAATILAMFMIRRMTPFVSSVIHDRAVAQAIADPSEPLARLVMLKAAILLVVVFFGYQGPVVTQTLSSGRINANRSGEGRRDTAIGFGVGVLNGYLIVGSLIFFIVEGNYPFSWVSDPLNFAPARSLDFINFLPQSILVSPWLGIVMAVAFVVIIIVVI